jgi:hypothetical protein
MVLGPLGDALDADLNSTSVTVANVMRTDVPGFEKYCRNKCVTKAPLWSDKWIEKEFQNLDQIKYKSCCRGHSLDFFWLAHRLVPYAHEALVSKNQERMLEDAKAGKEEIGMLEYLTASEVMSFTDKLAINRDKQHFG